MKNATIEAIVDGILDAVLKHTIAQPEFDLKLFEWSKNFIAGETFISRVKTIITDNCVLRGGFDAATEEQIKRVIEENQLTMDQIKPHIQERLDQMATERIEDVTKSAINEVIGDEIGNWFAHNNVDTDSIERFESEVEDIIDNWMEDYSPPAPEGISELKAKVESLETRLDTLIATLREQAGNVLDATTELKS